MRSRQIGFLMFKVMCFSGLVGLIVMTQPAQAQRALSQVLDLNRQAMEAYNNLEIDQAANLLDQAVNTADRGQVTGAALARTYVNMGIVAIGGLGDNARGLSHFQRALDIDATVELDPLLSTPDIQAVWVLARRSHTGSTASSSSSSGTGSTGTGSTGTGSTGTGSTGTSTGTGSTATGSSGSSGTSSVGAATSNELRHEAPQEQLHETALPLYAEPPTGSAHVYLYYRTHGMREFVRVEMMPLDAGVAYEIPCSDVFEPEVAYYIAAFDASGAPLAFVGSQREPILVPIVTRRSTAPPALPGRAPPEQCIDNECPPGMACGGSLGDSCVRDRDCASNRCFENACAPAGTTAAGASNASTSGPRFIVRVMGGLGASAVSGGESIDRDPCPEGSTDCDQLGATAQPLPPGEFTPDGLRRYGYAPVDGAAANDPCDYEHGSGCAFYVETPGLTTGFALRLEIGGYVIPRFLGLFATARIQPVSGRGDLSFGQFGLHLEIELTEPADAGWHAHVHLGAGFGQIQAFLGRGGRSDQAPWAISGLGYAELGGTIGYRFMRNFGLILQPTLNFGFPSFLFTIDAQLGLEIGF